MRRGAQDHLDESIHGRYVCLCSVTGGGRVGWNGMEGCAGAMMGDVRVVLRFNYCECCGHRADESAVISTPLSTAGTDYIHNV